MTDLTWPALIATKAAFEEIGTAVRDHGGLFLEDANESHLDDMYDKVTDLLQEALAYMETVRTENGDTPTDVAESAVQHYRAITNVDLKLRLTEITEHLHQEDIDELYYRTLKHLHVIIHQLKRIPALQRAEAAQA